MTDYTSVLEKQNEELQKKLSELEFRSERQLQLKTEQAQFYRNNIHTELRITDSKNNTIECSYKNSHYRKIAALTVLKHLTRCDMKYNSKIYILIVCRYGADIVWAISVYKNRKAKRINVDFKRYAVISDTIWCHFKNKKQFISAIREYLIYKGRA